MPVYEYECSRNALRVEVLHGMNESVSTWGELCDRAGIPPGETPADTPVKRLISAPSLAFPKSNTELKDLGFTKLVRRDRGVYENVTATGGESRYMDARDPSSMPKLQTKIGD